jgi:hypothetical protein
MGSTVRSVAQQAEAESAVSTSLRWRSWPLADHSHWSWLLPVGIVSTGVAVWWLGGGVLLGVAAATALAVGMWQFLLPVSFEICSSGVRRYAMGRMRLVPWQAIRAYQLRTTGVVFFQKTDPATIDLLSSLYVPYPSDEDEVVVAVRLYLPHAVEIP